MMKLLWNWYKKNMSVTKFRSTGWKFLIQRKSQLFKLNVIWVEHSQRMSSSTKVNQDSKSSGKYWEPFRVTIPRLIMCKEWISSSGSCSCTVTRAWASGFLSNLLKNANSETSSKKIYQDLTSTPISSVSSSNSIYLRSMNTSKSIK